MGTQAAILAEQLRTRLTEEAEGFPWVLGTLGRLALSSLFIIPPGSVTHQVNDTVLMGLPGAAMPIGTGLA
jgi:hypothetical protein